MTDVQPSQLATLLADPTAVAGLSLDEVTAGLNALRNSITDRIANGGHDDATVEADAAQAQANEEVAAEVIAQAQADAATKAETLLASQEVQP